MENWIGVGVWIVIGILVAMVMKASLKRPEETPGHAAVLIAIGAFGAVIGGMLGVGLFAFEDPLALSSGGMVGAVVFSALVSWIYRWGIRALV